MLFLSCMAGTLCAVIPSIELSVLLELIGIIGNNNFGLGRTGFLAFTFLFILGFLSFFWCTEGGPYRPGRGIMGANGIIGNDAVTIFGAMIFNFFLLVGIVLAIVYCVLIRLTPKPTIGSVAMETRCRHARGRLAPRGSAISGFTARVPTPLC